MPSSMFPMLPILLTSTYKYIYKKQSQHFKGAWGGHPQYKIEKLLFLNEVNTYLGKVKVFWDTFMH